jgi:dTDP-glucose pyrophosphorylase
MRAADASEFPLVPETLDKPAILPADGALDEAARRLLRDPAPLFLVATEAGLRVGAKSALRFFLQDRPEDLTSLATATDSSLICATQEEAAARLEREPTLEAVLLGAPDENPLRMLRRAVPDVTTAVVMAGGKGMRLRPLTENTPKPLLEVGGRSLLFRILDALSEHGVRRVFLSINYLGEKIRHEVGDGREWGLETSYLEESEPLDTGAGLVQLDPLDEPFFVVNGDVLTKLDFRAMGRFHLMSGALGTVATYRYAAPLPYGVVRPQAQRVEEIAEKPVFEYPVNAGIYVFSGEASRIVPKGKPLAMVDFLNENARAGRIARFPLIEDWNDVGSPDVFARAQEEMWSPT